MLIDSVLSNPRSLESIGRRGQFPPTKQCEVCALEMSDLPNRGRTVCISPCVLLMVVISLIEIGGCSGDGGISYAAWREIGVSSATLKSAGIRRST